MDADLVNKMNEAARVWEFANMTERDFSHEIVRRVPGTITVENSVAQGTADLCVPTQTGWLWVELKLMYGRRFLLKKSQYAALTADDRVLPPSLQRVFWIKGPSGYGWMAAEDIFEADRQPCKSGIWITVANLEVSITLEGLLSEFRCLRPFLTVVDR